MNRCAQALAFHLLRSHRRDLVRQLEYLRVENRILRGKLPKRITITPGERAWLLKFGKPLGTSIRHIISIVHPRTFARWKAEEKRPNKRRVSQAAKGPGGRPRKSKFLRDLVLRMARETDWGFTRIAAEIGNLHLGPIGRTTVRNILKAEGVEPGPRRSSVTWDTFLERHAKTLWACDFLSVRSWTTRGRLDLYLLVFIHIRSRRVVISPATRTPKATWVEQQARNFTIQLDESELECSYVLRDRDAKYTNGFDVLVRRHSTGQTKRLPVCSPNLNAHVERFIQTLKHECLNHFVIFGERHLDYLVSEFIDYYHRKRPHQGIGNATPIRCRGAPTRDGPIECESRLGGVLKHYRRAA